MVSRQRAEWAADSHNCVILFHPNLIPKATPEGCVNERWSPRQSGRFGPLVMQMQT